VLFEQLETKLVQNDKLIAEIDARRDGLTSSKYEEEEKISSHHRELQIRIDNAAANLRKKLAMELKIVDEKLESKRAELRNDSQLICAELDRLNELGGSVDEDVYTGESWEKLKTVLSKCYENDIVGIIKPTFHAAKTLSKVKGCDFGYLNVAELHPTDFILSLASPFSNIVLMNPDVPSKVVCRVFTEHEFSENIQANIKFSIKKKGFKEAVPIIREDSKLDSERKTFTIAFHLQDPGVYTVNVLLYDQHVSDSPLSIYISERGSIDVENNKDGVKQEGADSYLDKEVNSFAPSAFLDVSKVQAVRTSALRKPKSMSSEVVSTDRKDHQHSENAVAEPSVKKPVVNSSYIEAEVKSSKNGNEKVGGNYCSLPVGPLDLSGIKPGGRLKGDFVLSIENGTKQENLYKPIGMCILVDGRIAIASTFENKVKIFSNMGEFISEVISPHSFMKPSDMVTLNSGRFAVRDNTRVQVFESDGSFVKVLLEDESKDKYFGLAQDGEGRLITLLESRSPASTYLIFIDVENGEVCKKVELGDPNANKRASKCRFLTYYEGNIYITDLGLNYIYILDPITLRMKSFGSSGSDPGQFSDPAGLVVDLKGNMIIADSRNHRLCLFSKYGKFICNLHLKPEARRPSGVVLDRENKELYVLLLQGKSAMIKYKLT